MFTWLKRLGLGYVHVHESVCADEGRGMYSPGDGFAMYGDGGIVYLENGGERERTHSKDTTAAVASGLLDCDCWTWACINSSATADREQVCLTTCCVFLQGETTHDS